MIDRRNKIAVALVLILGCLGACAKREVPPTANSAPKRQVTDDLGRTVAVPARIDRAVSLAPNLTENIFAVGGGDRLVGVTTFCNYPEAAKQIAKIGDTMNPNIETIVALKPDVVFVSTASQIETFTNTLAQNGIAVYVTNPTSLDGVIKNLRQLGGLFGTEAAADKIASDLQARVVKAKPDPAYEIMPHPRVFVQISKEPLFTIGKQSFLTDMIVEAGGHSVTSDVESAYPKLSKESAVALDPDVIILSESEDNQEPNEVFKDSKAVKNSRVYKLNADILSRPGPRLVDAFEQISGILGLQVAR